MINARAESLADKPAYERAFRRHRCLVPAEGFYEWQRRGSEQAADVHPPAGRRADGVRRAVGGVARREGRRRPTGCGRASIVTTNANDTVAPLHDRMPVVLEERDWDRWLDPEAGDVDALATAARRRRDDDLLVAYPVGTRVNSADNDGPELVERVELQPTLGL